MLWITQNIRYVTVGLGIVILAAILLIRFLGFSSSENAREYLDAESDFVKIWQGKESQQSLQNLSLILNKHPELHAKFDGLLAQILLNQGQVEEAMPYAVRTLRRTQDENAPYFKTFSEITLLVAQKKYTDALHQTQILQKNLNASSSFPGIDVLQVFNTLRLASLQQQLNLPKAELNTWQEWQKIANLNPAITAAILKHFKEGIYPLENYIDYRRKFLEGIK